MKNIIDLKPGDVFYVINGDWFGFIGKNEKNQNMIFAKETNEIDNLDIKNSDIINYNLDYRLNLEIKNKKIQDYLNDYLENIQKNFELKLHDKLNNNEFLKIQNTFNDDLKEYYKLENFYKNIKAI